MRRVFTVSWKNRMRKGVLFILALAFLSFIQEGASEAANFDFSGTINYNTDVVYIPFSLFTDATDVMVWTDSFQDGANFDPITAVWTASGNLVGENDDNPTIAPGQTAFDSGLVFSELGAGDYLFTIATFNNFAVGSILSEGFFYDGTTPEPITEWWVRAPGNWSVHLSGVDSATTSVPEPCTMILLAPGLLGLVRLRKRFRS
jgi:hypothetical protein